MKQVDKLEEQRTGNTVNQQPNEGGAVVDPSQNKAGEITIVDEEPGGFEQFGGVGLTGLTKDDLAIPFWTILQSNSPQVKRSDGAYIEGAVEGMLFNSVTKQIVDPAKTPVLVVPTFYDRNFIEWRLRENGGGFIKQHPVSVGLTLLEHTTRDEKGRDITEQATQLNDTRTHYVIMIGEEGITSPGVISMTSTQIKKSKQWLMQQNLLKLRGPQGLYTPPMFASIWRVRTVPESNEKGSWMGWAFEHTGYLKGPKDPIFLEAKAFHESVKVGAVKADFAKAAEDGAVSGGDEDHIPF